MKILMVCLGNICRSPLAEGIMKAKIAANGLDWEVDSAGTGGWHSGELPDHRSIKVAKKYGIDISNQRARKLKSNDLNDFDLIFAMDSSNLQDIQSLAQNPAQKQKIKLILNELNPDKNENVPDPYYGDEKDFELVFKMLSAACERVLQNLNIY